MINISKDDPDYKRLLSAFEQGKKEANALPEADMPGFSGRPGALRFNPLPD
ncbi:MAG: hypothetical protein Q4G69_10700 [Planctomycetia bacterium]|nr:hypothetical protein [Planctomycetia bacterium]